MKITWIVPHFPPHIGGGEQLYLNVCRGLLKRGNEVRVVTSNSGGVTGYRRVQGLDVWYCRWPLLFGHPLVRPSDLTEHVKWCDIVHTAIYSTAVSASAAAAAAGKPCVTTVHEVMGRKWSWFEPNPLKACVYRFYERLVLMSARNVHVVSRATERDCLAACRGHKGKKVFQIYNFLDLPPAEEIRKQKITFSGYFSLEKGERGLLYFGRPARNKGIFVLLRAIRRIPVEELRKNHVRFCLILAPNPPREYREALRRIREYGIGEYVRVRPSLPREALFKVLKEADCCVIPSITEGFGYAAAEACALGRPVICSDGGSLPEVVWGKCLFFRNRDEKDLSEKLISWIRKGTAEFSEMEERRFEREKIIGEYLEMYGKLLRENGGRARRALFGKRDGHRKQSLRREGPRYVIDGAFITRRRTGIERYAENLTKELDRLVKPGELSLLLPENTEAPFPLKNITLVRYGKGRGYMWEQTALPIYLKKQRAEGIFFCNAVPFLYRKGIAALHDIGPEVRPELFRTSLYSRLSLLFWRLMYRAIAGSRMQIITPSEFSGSEIRKRLHVNPGRITVIRNGWQHMEEVVPEEDILEKLGLKSRGFYYAMATVLPNKNLRWISEAARSHPRETFVLAGKGSEKLPKAALPSNLIAAGYVSDGEAKALMKHCRAFLFPSFYEGFGIPPMEALSAGAEAVILSDIPCLREVYGDIAAYVDPCNYEEIRLECFPPDRASVRAFLSRYSWRSSAEALLELLRAQDSGILKGRKE